MEVDAVHSNVSLHDVQAPWHSSGMIKPDTVVQVAYLDSGAASSSSHRCCSSGTTRGGLRTTVRAAKESHYKKRGSQRFVVYVYVRGLVHGLIHELCAQACIVWQGEVRARRQSAVGSKLLSHACLSVVTWLASGTRVVLCGA